MIRETLVVMTRSAMNVLLVLYALGGLGAALLLWLVYDNPETAVLVLPGYLLAQVVLEQAHAWSMRIGREVVLDTRHIFFGATPAPPEPRGGPYRLPPRGGREGDADDIGGAASGNPLVNVYFLLTVGIVLTMIGRVGGW